MALASGTVALIACLLAAMVASARPSPNAGSPPSRKIYTEGLGPPRPVLGVAKPMAPVCSNCPMPGLPHFVIPSECPTFGCRVYVVASNNTCQLHDSH